MSNKIYPLAKDTITNLDKKKVTKLINSNGKLTMDKNVEKLEQKFAKIHNMRFCTMLNSGSSANLIMIASLFYHKDKLLRPKDEVIVPVLGWSTTYYPLLQYQITPVFVDIDPKTFNISIKDLERNITKKTKAILLVNVLGNPSDFAEILKIAKKHNLIILEDNCESLGAKYKNKLTGSFGLISTCSSYFSHHISTIEGGYLLTNSSYINSLSKSLRSHGWARDKSSENLIKAKSNMIDNKFLFLLPGYNLRPTEINAVLGLQQLKKLNQYIKIRRFNHSVISKIISGMKNFYLQEELGEASWFGFGIVYKKKSKINFYKIMDFLEKKGVETRPIITGNFINQPVIKYFKYRKSKYLKNINMLDKYGFMIGNNSEPISFKLSKQLENIFNKIDKI